MQEQRRKAFVIATDKFDVECSEVETLMRKARQESDRKTDTAVSRIYVSYSFTNIGLAVFVQKGGQEG